MEAAEAANLTEMGRILTRHMPDAAFEPFAGGVAIFAGIESPMTHAVGVGLRGAVAQEEMERMEAFFQDRGSACIIDLCPMADPSVIAFVQSRPYRVVEFNNVLARAIRPDEDLRPASGVRAVAEAELGLWSRTIAEGFSEQLAVTNELLEVMEGTALASQCWLAGEPGGSGGAAMGIRDGVAMFYGDSVLLPERRKGWQSALIRSRLAAAHERGCDLAIASVLPGSGSHRNYERAGFQLIYMRVNLRRDL